MCVCGGEAKEAAVGKQRWGGRETAGAHKRQNQWGNGMGGCRGSRGPERASGGCNLAPKAMGHDRGAAKVPGVSQCMGRVARMRLANKEVGEEPPPGPTSCFPTLRRLEPSRKFLKGQGNDLGIPEKGVFSLSG